MLRKTLKKSLVFSIIIACFCGAFPNLTHATMQSFLVKKANITVNGVTYDIPQDPSWINQAILGWKSIFSDAAQGVGNDVAIGITTALPKALSGFITHFFIDGFFMIATGILIISTFLFNIIFEITLVDMGGLLGRFTAIGAVWKLMRDLGNVVMIFTLLYYSFSLMLNLDEGGVKRGISKLIIVAMLINFSMFFTKSIIDVGNILALGFYNKISISNESQFEKENKVLIEKLRANNLLGYFVQGYSAAKRSVGLASAFLSGFNFQKIKANPGSFFQNATSVSSIDVTLNNVLTIHIIGTLMMLFLSIVFLAATIIFIKGFIVLLVLIIISPLAFIAMVLPRGMGEEMGGTFWKKLISEALAAPVFMFMIWLGFKIITDEQFKLAIKSDNYPFLSLPVIFSYTIANFILVGSLIASQKVGASGAEQAINVYKGVKGWVGQNTVGRAAYQVLEKGGTAHWLYQTRADGIGRNIPFVGKGVQAMTKFGASKIFDTLHHTASSKFDSIPSFGDHGHGDHGHGDHGHEPGGFAKKISDDAKKKMDWINENKNNPKEWIGTLMLKQYKEGNNSDYDTKVVERVIETMKIEDLAEMTRTVDLEKKELEEKDKEGKLGAKEKERLAVLQGFRELIDHRLPANTAEQLRRKVEGPTRVNQIEFDRLAKNIFQRDAQGNLNSSGRTMEEIVSLQAALRELRKNPNATPTVKMADGTVKTFIGEVGIREAQKKIGINYKEKNISALRQYYSSLNGKQKTGLTGESLINKAVLDLNNDTDVFEQMQREAKQTGKEKESMGSVGLSHKRNFELYSKIKEKHAQNQDYSTEESELIENLRDRGLHIEGEGDQMRELTPEELLKKYVAEEYNDGSKLEKYFKNNGARFYGEESPEREVERVKEMFAARRQPPAGGATPPPLPGGPRP